MARKVEFMIKEDQQVRAVYAAEENQHMPEYYTVYRGELTVDGTVYVLPDQMALKTAFLYWVRHSIPVEWEEHVDDVLSYYEGLEKQLEKEAKDFQEFLEGTNDDLPF